MVEAIVLKREAAVLNNRRSYQALCHVTSSSPWKGEKDNCCPFAVRYRGRRDSLPVAIQFKSMIKNNNLFCYLFVLHTYIQHTHNFISPSM